MDRRRDGPLRDDTPTPAPALAPPLVGRAGELQRLTEALQAVAGGRGRALFLTGEAGIGKTRLARAALALARARGFQVLAGRAYPLEGALAYAPLLDAFAPLLRDLGESRRAPLVRDLPHLGRLFGDLRLPVPEPLGDPALEKTRLFEAVARLLERLARQAPVALLLDDLHWADPASLELLHYLARGLDEQRVLLLATYRPDEADAARGLRALLRSLHRLELSEEIAVERLGPGAVAALVAGLLGGEAPADLLALVAARSAGTPLIVEALIRACVEAGQLVRAHDTWVLTAGAAAALPPGARALILERLERLESPARRVLDLIAVGGDAPAHALLTAAGGLDEDALLAALQRLHAAGLLVEQRAGPHVAYGLSHPLIQEVAYAELPEMARRRAHAAFAAALERLRPGDLDALARHYCGAGPEADQGRALDVLMAAGERARALSAHDAAARHFGAALALARAGQRPELLPTLLEWLGEAWEQVGEGGAAVAVWTQALAEYERADDRAAMARLRRLLALAEWERGHFDDAEAHLAAGLAALVGHNPSSELADLHHARVTLLHRRGDIAAAATEELLALAHHLGSPRALAEARIAETLYYHTRGDNDTAYERALRALADAEAAAAPVLIHQARHLLGIVLFALGDHRRAREHAERSLALARQLGAPSLELLPRLHRISADLLAGAWDEAMRESAATVALARRLDRPRGTAAALCVRALLLAHRGDLAGAEACLAEAGTAFAGEVATDRHNASTIGTIEALIAVERSDADRLPTVAAEDALTWAPGVGGIPAFGLALRAEAQIAVGEAERALVVARELAALHRAAPGDGAAAEVSYPAALAARVEGLARQALGQPAVALDCLARAVATFDALAMPFEVARARLEWAGLAAPLDPSAAVTALRESLQTFERLGASRYADRARHRLRQLGVRTPAARRHRPAGGPLSARELEVARLVAERLTNAQIAERLYLSPRTVTTHLERIYARLGIASRAELARYVLDTGLAAPDGQDYAGPGGRVT